jgi:LysR family glycine cleavage system transcriptional activator
LTRPEDLAHHTLLDEVDYDSWGDWLTHAGMPNLEARQRIVIDDSNVRLQAAINGQGVELTCRSLIDEDLAAGRLVQPFNLSLEDFAYYLVYPSDAALGPNARRFCDWLLAEAKAG